VVPTHLVAGDQDAAQFGLDGHASTAAYTSCAQWKWEAVRVVKE